MRVKVTLFRRTTRGLRKVDSATVLVKRIGDRDHDSLPDGVFRATFARPPIPGRYRCRASFAGDPDHRPASATRRFRL
jgi:hypothetical protein